MISIVTLKPPRNRTRSSIFKTLKRIVQSDYLETLIYFQWNVCINLFLSSFFFNMNTVLGVVWRREREDFQCFLPAWAKLNRRAFNRPLVKNGSISILAKREKENAKDGTIIKHKRRARSRRRRIEEFTCIFFWET